MSNRTKPTTQLYVYIVPQKEKAKQRGGKYLNQIICSSPALGLAVGLSSAYIRNSGRANPIENNI